MSQILPLLDKLDLDELDVVREREEQGKGRSTLLRALDDRIDDLEGDDDLVDDVADDDIAADDVAPAVEVEVVEEDEVEVVGEPVAAGTDDFPIPDYDGRTVAQILAVLDDLDNDELDMVAEREELGRNRAAILDAIDAMFDDEEPAPPPPVKRAPAKKTPAVKKAAPVKAAPVRAAPVKKAPAKKAPAPTRAPAKKVAAAKKAVAVTKASAPTKRVAASVKKAPAKRAAPTKRV